MSLYIRNEAGEFIPIPSIKGSDGITPHIGDNGNWFIGDTDTGKPSRGEDGVKTVNGMTPDENGNVEIPVSGGSVDLSGYATEQFVQDGFQPKGDYLPSEELPNAVNDALADAKESGAFDGKNGSNGLSVLAVNITAGDAQKIEVYPDNVIENEGALFPRDILIGDKVLTEDGKIFIVTSFGTKFDVSSGTSITYYKATFFVDAGGVTNAEKNLILTLFRNAAYTTPNMADTLSQLEALWSGGSENEPDVPDVTTYTIIAELANVVSSNSATSVAEGASYTATLVADDGYMLDSVTVIMGGVDVTADVYANGVISIPAVTGDVEIVATARAAEIKAELITDGLMAYFDFRNLGDKANVTVDTTKGVMATQGSGALYSWDAQPITSSDNYGIKTPRAMKFSAEGNTTQTDLGTEFTVISFGYGECIGPGIKATNIDPRWQFMPSYNKADGTANAAATDASELNGDNMKDYNYAVYRVSGANLTMINDSSRKDYNGNDYEGFVSWNSKPGMGRTAYGEGYGTAVAIYNRALSDVEIEEMRAFMKTLEVA